jgi:D-apiose dehydrogenase
VKARFALLGAGFWAGYQLAAWRETGAAECVAVADPDRVKASALAERFGVPHVYDDPAALIADSARLGVSFADVVTPPGTHKDLVLRCAGAGLGVSCQKPMAESVADAEAMVAACEATGVPFVVHENWRWQTPLREAGRLLHGGAVGTPFRARLTFSCSFPVFDNQPFLATLPRFILTDIGSHVLDAARYLFGEARSVYCLTKRVNPKIAGEDVVTVMMPMGEAETTVTCEMSYASRLENERFPETFLLVEGDRGSLEIGPGGAVRLTDERGTWQSPHTLAYRAVPPRYEWANPAYDLVMASMVPCLADLLKTLTGTGASETTGRDNLETVRLVYASYESARSGAVVPPR